MRQHIFPLSDEKYPAYLRLYLTEIEELFVRKDLPNEERISMFEEEIGGLDRVKYLIDVVTDPVRVLDTKLPNMGHKSPRPISDRATAMEKINYKKELESFKRLVEKTREVHAPRLKLCEIQRFLWIITHDRKAIKKLDELIQDSDGELYDNVHLWADGQNPNVEEFLRSFYRDDATDLLDCCAASMDPEFLMKKVRNTHLRDIIKQTEPENGFGVTLHEKRARKTRVWARSLLRELPRQEVGETSWFLDLVDAAHSDPYNLAMLHFLLPDYEQKLAERTELLSQQRRAAMKGVCSNNEKVAKETYDFRPQNDYTEFKEKSTLKEIISEPICLREYQQELAEKAVRGNNTIVCAPTGSGKTVVAAYVIKDHLDKRRKIEQRNARVVMLVPTRVLVEQQVRALHRYLKAEYYVEGFSGDEAVKGNERLCKVLSCDVAVMTSGVLGTLLASIRDADKLFVSDITLLVMDEVHSCTKDHEYRVIVSRIHDYPKDELKPQIVGLTASLITSTQASHHSEAAMQSMMETIYDLCANVGATSISSVLKHKDSLEAAVSRPQDEVMSVEQRAHGVAGTFTERLRLVMDAIFREVSPTINAFCQQNKRGIVLNEVFVTRASPTATNARHSQTLLQGILGLRSELQRIPSSEKHKGIVATQVLEVLCRGLVISDLMPCFIAFKYIEDSFGESSAEGDSLRAKLIEYYMQARDDLRHLVRTEEDTPILKKLIEVLQKQFATNPDSKGLVFVTQRSTAQKLQEFLNSRNVLEGHLPFGYVTSTSQKSSEAGQTASEQQDTIRAFRTGQKKVLVVTSVAEEGLDIPECNLVIKYNCVSSAKGRIQQRGRARAKNSRSVLLALSDTIQQGEFRNMMLEFLMNRCLEIINKNGHMELENKVREKMQHQKAAREQERRALENKKIELQDKLFRIECRTCASNIVESRFLRKVDNSDHVIVDPDIWSRVNIDLNKHKKTKDGKFIDHQKQVLCEVLCPGPLGGECNERLGNVISFAGVYLPSVKISAIAMKEILQNGRESSNLDIVPRWDSVGDRFFIPLIGDNELKDMLNAIPDDSKDCLNILRMKLNDERRRADDKKRELSSRPFHQNKDEWKDIEENEEEFEHIELDC